MRYQILVYILENSTIYNPICLKVYIGVKGTSLQHVLPPNDVPHLEVIPSLLVN